VAQQWIGGVDAHKQSLTVAVVEPAGAEVAAASFANTEAGLVEVLAWLAGRPATLARIGVEGSAGHGRHLAAVLVAAGYDVREVPARRTAQRRRQRRRAKTDIEDAYAIARATAGEPKLGPVQPGAGLGPAHEELVVLVGHRGMLVERRKTMLNHAEAVLAALPLALTDRLRGRAVLPRLRALLGTEHGDQPAPVRAQLALLAELHTDLADLSGRIRALESRLHELIGVCGSTLTAEHGIGVVTAATLLAEVGDPTRFRTESAFNRWWGGAPVAISSGEGHDEPTRHRLDLLGNRTVNHVLHIMSVTQARYHPPAGTYLEGKRAAGHTRREARRAHKTLLGRRIIRRMWTDHHRQRSTRQDQHQAAA
jgi:transposase